MSWWDTRWKYRIPITITEQSGSTLEDYQVKIVVDTASLIAAGKMNPDGSDIRITKPNPPTKVETFESGIYNWQGDVRRVYYDSVRGYVLEEQPNSYDYWDSVENLDDTYYPNYLKFDIYVSNASSYNNYFGVSDSIESPQSPLKGNMLYFSTTSTPQYRVLTSVDSLYWGTPSVGWHTVEIYFDWNMKTATVVFDGSTVGSVNIGNMNGVSSLIMDAGSFYIDDVEINTYGVDEYELPFWIEEGTINTTETVIWVRVPKILGGAQQTIYMYYGNPTASSASDGDKTFDFFDGFNGTTLDTSKWAIGSQTGTISVSGGKLTIEASSNQLNYIYSTRSFSSPIIMEARVDLNSIGTGGRLGFGLDMDTSAGHATNQAYEGYTYGTNYPDNWKFVGFYYVDTFSPQSQYYRNGFYTVGGAASNATITYYTYPSGSYHNVKIVFDQSASKADIDGSNIATHTTNIPSESLNIWLKTQVYSGFSAISRIYVDRILIRKYASAEPTYSIGAEETRGPAISTFSETLTLSDSDQMIFTDGLYQDSVGFYENFKVIEPREFQFGLPVYHYPGKYVSKAHLEVGGSGKFKVYVSSDRVNWVELTANELKTLNTSSDIWYLKVKVYPPSGEISYLKIRFE